MAVATNWFDSHSFLFLTTRKSTALKCIKGGIFRRTKWGKAEHT